MSEETLAAWLEYHAGAYPGFGKWLRTNPDQVKHIGRTLYGLELVKLREATDLLYALPDQPQGYGSHARRVAELVRQTEGGPHGIDDTYGPKLVGGILVASCPRCMDYALVEVLNPRTIAALKAGTCERLATCMIRCDCAKGKAHPLRSAPIWSAGFPLISYADLVQTVMEWDESPQFDVAMLEVARSSFQQVQSTNLDRTDEEFPK